jgi:predicted Zn-dependent protease
MLNNMVKFDQTAYDQLVAEGDIQQARDILLKQIKKTPKEHWFHAELSGLYYEERRYKEALRYSTIAYRIQPDDALVLWYHAGNMLMSNQEATAIQLFEKIERLGLEYIAYGPFGEGMRWAKSMMYDTFYRLASAYYDVGNYEKAAYYIEKTLAYRTQGIPSLYSLKEVKDLRKKIFTQA